MTAVLSKDDTQYLDDVLETVLDKMFQAAVRGTGVNVEPSKTERVKLKIIETALNMARHYSPEAKLQKFVSVSNKLVPQLSKVFDEEAIVAMLPPEAKDQKVIDLCEKAGATAIAGVLRQGTAAAAPAAPAVT